MAKKSNAEILRELLEATGGVDQEIDLAKYEQKEKERDIEQENAEIKKYEKKAETPALLRSLHYPHEFRFIKCSWCGFVFQTNYCSTAYCSDGCMKSYLKTIGVMNPSTSKITKEYEEPLTVGPDTLRQIYDWAVNFVQGYEFLDRINDEPKNNPRRARLQYVSHTPSGKTVVQYAEVQDQDYGLPFISQGQANLEVPEVTVSQHPEPNLVEEDPLKNLGIDLDLGFLQKDLEPEPAWEFPESLPDSSQEKETFEPSNKAESTTEDFLSSIDDLLGGL